MPKKTEPTRRITATLPESEVKQIEFWAEKQDLKVNDFIREALEFRIRWLNKDYDLPPMEIQRLNQLIDGQQVLSRNVQELEKVIISGFESLIGLTKGDSYLMDAEDGEV